MILPTSSLFMHVIKTVLSYGREGCGKRKGVDPLCLRTWGEKEFKNLCIFQVAPGSNLEPGWSLSL